MEKTILLAALALTFLPTEAFIFPLLFPVSIKITFHHKPPPPPPEPVYHLQTVPVYKEIVVKGADHNEHKQSYGDGYKGSSYGDGYSKAYSGDHTKGVDYGTTGSSHSGYQTKGANYGTIGSAHSGETAYKGTAYDGNLKGTTYDDDYDTHPIAVSHAKGNTYADIETAYKGNSQSGSRGFKAPSYSSNYDDGSSGKGTSYEHGYVGYGTYKSQDYSDNAGYGVATNYGDQPNLHYAESNQKERSPELQNLAGFGTSVYGDSYAKMVYRPPKAQRKVSGVVYKH